MTIETEHEHNSTAEAIRQLRTHVTALLGSGAGPKELAFAMSYVATEMAMQLLPSSLEAVPVVVTGMAAAAKAKVRRDESEQVDAEPADGLIVGPPDNATLH